MLTYGKEAIEWRRARVLELESQGYSQHEIATKLLIANGTVNSDLAYLRKQAQANLQHHIHETVPEEYQKCMIGMKRNLKQTLEIAEGVTDPRVKLEARRIANDCYRYIMDLCTNAGIISDAINYVNNKQEQIHTLQKSEEIKIKTEAEAKAIDDGTTNTNTTNGVF